MASKPTSEEAMAAFRQLETAVAQQVRNPESLLKTLQFIDRTAMRKETEDKGKAAENHNHNDASAQLRREHEQLSRRRMMFQKETTRHEIPQDIRQNAEKFNPTKEEQKSMMRSYLCDMEQDVPKAKAGLELKGEQGTEKRAEQGDEKLDRQDKGESAKRKHQWWGTFGKFWN